MDVVVVVVVEVLVVVVVVVEVVEWMKDVLALVHAWRWRVSPLCVRSLGQRGH